MYHSKVICGRVLGNEKSDKSSLTDLPEFASITIGCDSMLHIHQTSQKVSNTCTVDFAFADFIRPVFDARGYETSVAK